MPKVHLFPTISDLSEGFRLPLQYLGTSETPAARAVPDTVLLSWILANIPAVPISVSSQSVADGGTIGVNAGRMVAALVVIGNPSGTFNVGTSTGATDILGGEAFDSDGAAYVLFKYFNSSGTLHFSGGFLTPLTVKLVLINLS